MKQLRLLSVVALAAAALGCVSLTTDKASAQASPGGAHTNVIVGMITEDVDVALPAHINVANGTVILFIRKPSVGSDVTVQPGATPAGASAHLEAVAVGNAPPGYNVFQAFRVVGNGTVTIDVYHTYVIPGAKPFKSSSMEIAVQ